MNINELMNKQKDYIIEMRRHFHMHPELSMEEYETTKKIGEELEKMGIAYEIPDKKVGVIGLIEGGKPGKTVALRADIDALPIQQANDVSYKSKVDGKMHACGHDGHTAILLGAAQILNEIKEDLAGNVYLVFQPSEETGEGAEFMMEFGDWFEKTDNIFGGHVWAGLETGKISVEEGPRMAAADRFKVEIQGISGHGAMPEGTVDATVVASAMVMNLQSLASRTYNPTDPIAFTVGKVESGSRFNVISGSAVLEGTARYFTDIVADTIVDNFERIVKSTAQTYGAKANIEYEHLTLITKNDEYSTKIGQGAVEKVLGAQALGHVEKTTGGEDFSYYVDKIPGAFAFIGSGNPEKKTDVAHHNECFDIDEDALVMGAGVYAQYAIDFLEDNK